MKNVLEKYNYSFVELPSFKSFLLASVVENKTSGGSKDKAGWMGV